MKTTISRKLADGPPALRISKTNAINAINSPDDIQIIKLDGDDHLSELRLYAKRVEKPGRSLMIILVAMYRGDTDELQVCDGYKIYEGLADIAAVTPLEAMESLVDKFGLNIRVGNQRGKFIYDQKIPLDGDSNDPNKIVEIEGELPADVEQCFMLKVDDKDGNKVASVGMAYALDMTAYGKYVRES